MRNLSSYQPLGTPAEFEAELDAQYQRQATIKALRQHVDRLSPGRQAAFVAFVGGLGVDVSSDEYDEFPSDAINAALMAQDRGDGEAAYIARCQPVIAALSSYLAGEA